MAEFQEVCKQWSRMCANCNCGNKQQDDGGKLCPIIYRHNGYPCDDTIVDMTLAGIAQLEEIVMDWAAEHPVPVYPTWGEWLAEQGELCKNWKDIRVISSAGNSAAGVIGWFYKNIPADIAEKLGIEPKEG